MCVFTYVHLLSMCIHKCTVRLGLSCLFEWLSARQPGPVGQSLWQPNKYSDFDFVWTFSNRQDYPYLVRQGDLNALFMHVLDRYSLAQKAESVHKHYLHLKTWHILII